MSEERRRAVYLVNIFCEAYRQNPVPSVRNWPTNQLNHADIVEDTSTITSDVSATVTPVRLSKDSGGP